MNDKKLQSILIVDDEPDLALLLKLQLEDAGYTTNRAKNSSEFYELLTKGNFSLVLLDIHMPGVSGFTLLDHIKKEYQLLPVVTMTAHGSEDIAIAAMKRGAVDYLSKPFSTADLLEKITGAIATSEFQRLNIELDQKAADEMKKLRDEVKRLQRINANSIIKSIEFDEDAYQAGVSILSYFSTIVKQKYPNIKVKVRIEQEGRTVRLVIETPDGEKEKIEKTLEDYGLVVVGEMQPEELFPVKIEEMQLRHKLDMAVMEITHTRELLSFTKESQAREIAGLREEVDYLKNQIREAFKREDHSRDVLLKIIDSYSVDGAAKSLSFPYRATYNVAM